MNEINPRDKIYYKKRCAHIKRYLIKYKFILPHACAFTSRFISRLASFNKLAIKISATRNQVK